ncbi:uncharacterized protein KNAG_0B05440 [Huiozyma naganishii CBS 8797]|uniref:Retrovirus-related Pol polyprotein from transposon TNT 1-94-like beta-barrel domain-containing protein n=1 Tax=Huiozyma naganishii (strain ATCC MYA-139 / BCRC 22969 / CBS 8797 / KCTC 17520 / NBRC 10181 / NCYC 3082 / Yp74L-3) TaxID=1071383 RepID=J7RVN7_HUIN7|nr:hypothetical protein KNAG_0B05440 [Kazachstania naganishii CBS 8797]CCK68977.1 hypothetical protein KNAG_0B05440 [Kazachstania naganishii CBS 8797]
MSSEVKDILYSLRNLQVMNPDKLRFMKKLSSFSNYPVWVRQFEMKIKNNCRPLFLYLKDEENKVYNFDYEEVSEKKNTQAIVGLFNDTIFGMINATATGKALEIVEQVFFSEADYNEVHFGKMLLLRIAHEYENPKLIDVVSLLEDWMKPLKTAEEHEEIFKSLLANRRMLGSELFLAAFAVYKAPPNTQRRLVDKFGRSSTVDIADLFRTGRGWAAEEFKSSKGKSESSALVVQKKEFRPCRHCNGNHYDNKCPKQKKKWHQAKLMSVGNEDEPSGLIARVAFADNQPEKTGNWYLDSGCSMHMTGSKNSFETLEMKGGGAVHGIGASLKIQGNGIVELGKYTVNDTAYVPNLPRNLLSVSKMTQKTGKCVIFTES